MCAVRFLLVVVLFVAAELPIWGADPYGLTTRASVGAFLNNNLPPTRPGVGSGDYYVEDVFPGLTFNDPTFMTFEPNSDRLYVSGRQGTIHFFTNTPGVTTKRLFLDLTVRTQGFEDCGLLGFAFHPEWRQPGSTNRGFVYVFYQYTTNRVFPPPDRDRPDPFLGTWMRLSRFTVPDNQLVADPNSEQVLINQFDRHLWHNGGNVMFGTDGFLYLPVGDEGGIDDEFNQAQRMNGGLFSGVLRIDVNSDPTKSHPIRRQPQSPPGMPPSFTANYSIPNDNPWLDPGGSILEEFYAIGLRSPHRMTLDPPTGRIWLGDIGQNTREEIDLIERGGNYQWSYREASVTTEGSKPKPSPIVGIDKPPVYEYVRDAGDTCVIGGYVYRGNQLPGLQGKYIFGDNTSGRIWSLTYNGSNNPPSVAFLCHMPVGHNYEGLASFGLDRHGEIYALKMGPSGKVLKLMQSGQPTVFAPARLSLTGAFANTPNLTPHAALLPYSVNSPLWSDGSAKSRWMMVPNNGAPYTANEQVAFTPTGEWTFPSGTVFVKHFELGTNDLNPTLRKRLETRLIVRDTNGSVYGLTYKWRPDNSDADLLSDSLSEDIVINTGTGTRTQTWFYPSPQDCLTCHNPNAGHILGFNTRQLNGNFTYAGTGVTDNQLRALNRAGLFNPALNESAISNYTKLVPVTDTTAPIEKRMRSYLDANCAQCHRPGGVQGNWDGRFETPLANQNILDGPVFNNFGIPNAREVAPGSVGRSIMHLRMNTNGVAKMPPLARNVIDTNAVAALAQWINSFVPGGLPSPWQHQDVGSVLLAGSATYTTNTSTFSVSGAGTDIFGSADSFHYMWQDANGDSEVVARVASITDTDAWAKAGVMIRESLAPNAANAYLAATAQNGVEFQWRTVNGGGSFYVQGPMLSVPYWLRLNRTNNVFRAYHSATGNTWTQLGSDLNLNLSVNATLGLAVTAVNPNALNTSTFDFVRVNGSSGAADSDGDGMPDAYEIANGFNKDNASDANLDTDGDAMSNLQEYRAGTNPRSAASVLRLTRVTRQGNDVVLTFLSATGKTYSLELATNLPSASWQTLTNIGPVTGTNLVFTNLGGAKTPRGFYRLKVTP